MINQRTQRSRAFAPDPDAQGRTCEIPGCPAGAGYRAPKSRTSLNEYWWFCLDHVREYNGAWDFYKGMSAGQIEAQIRADTRWQRPSWPLGRLGSGQIDEEALRDPLGVLSAAGVRGGRRAASEAARPELPAKLRQPLELLGLAWPVSLDELKSRYKTLAKRHHPDANHGDRAAEERLKEINLAYSALRRHLGGASEARGAA